MQRTLVANDQRIEWKKINYEEYYGILNVSYISMSSLYYVYFYNVIVSSRVIFSQFSSFSLFLPTIKYFVLISLY